MSAPNQLTGKAPRHRARLPRVRKAFLVRFRPAVWRQLLELGREGESATETLERLVTEAKPAKRLCV